MPHTATAWDYSSQAQAYADGEARMLRSLPRRTRTRIQSGSLRNRLYKNRASCALHPLLYTFIPPLQYTFRISKVKMPGAAERRSLYNPLRKLWERMLLSSLCGEPRRARCRSVRKLGNPTYYPRLRNSKAAAHSI